MPTFRNTLFHLHRQVDVSFISVTLKSWSRRKLLDPPSYIVWAECRVYKYRVFTKEVNTFGSLYFGMTVGKYNDIYIV